MATAEIPAPGAGSLLGVVDRARAASVRDRRRHELTPAQHEALTGLLDPGGSRPTFADGIGLQLLDRLEAGVGDTADTLDSDLAVNKRDLAQVHACEVHHLAERAEPFEWSAAAARGTVAHRALEMGAFRADDPSPLQLVDDAIRGFIESGDDWTPREWLLAASESELAELRSEANDVVAKFQECFPPLDKDWRPRLESKVRVDLCGGRIVLRSKVDLALGRPRGNEARSLIIDFKTGHRSPSHLDDLRYYALVETIRMGVPPFRVATYYLDSARWQSEDITEAVLEATARRVVAGVIRLAELRSESRPPELVPGPTCGYCRLRSECDGARQWSEQREQLGVDA